MASCGSKDVSDDVIIRGGFKVHAPEVEEVLRGHPAVAEAAVVGVAHASLNQVPVAAVVLKPATEAPSEQELMDLVRSKKPPYCVPTKIRVVDVLPRNAMLKVIPGAVRELLELK